MRSILIIASAIVSLLIAGPASSEANGPDPMPIIEGLASDLPSIKETLDDLDAAPEERLFGIGDKESYRGDLNAMLDDAFELVLPDVYAEAKAEITEIDAAIDLGVSERSELVVRRATAREDGGEPSLLDRVRGREVPSGSKEHLSKLIADVDSELETLRKIRSTRIDAFRESLRTTYGIDLDRTEAEAAIYQVNGGNIVDGLLVTKVLITVEEQLRKFVSSDIDAETARRYYGVAAISRLVIVRTHERHLANYDGKWLPKLEALERDNEDRQEEIDKTLQKTLNSSQKETMEANRRVRDLIGETIESYRKVLVRRQEITRKLLKEARIDAEVAIGTLRTLESVAELSSLLDDSFSEFNSVLELTPPDLVPLDDREMFERFLDLSRQMQGS